MTESILRTSAEKSGLMHKKFNIFLDQKSPACKILISIIQTLNLSLHCNYPKLRLTADERQPWTNYVDNENE